MSTVRKIPSELQKFIDRYFHLQIAGIEVICPYFINTSGFLKKPVFSGKGSPSDIEMTTNQMLSNHSFVNVTSDMIRKEMLDLDIGLDCSGLVYQTIHTWLFEIEGKGEFKDYLPKESLFSLRKALSRKLKPESSVNADMFTSEPLSTKIEVKNVQPGDLIRSRGGKHILFITEVEYKLDIPVRITFVHSGYSYKRNGMRYGTIYLNTELDLLSSKWDDNDPEEPVNHAYKGFREKSDNNGIFRPNLPLTVK